MESMSGIYGRPPAHHAVSPAAAEGRGVRGSKGIEDASLAGYGLEVGCEMCYRG